MATRRRMLSQILGRPAVNVYCYDTAVALADEHTFLSLRN